ncbi:hypothetical protein ACFL59_06020 [Planctomycetota bacterium]
MSESERTIFLRIATEKGLLSSRQVAEVLAAHAAERDGDDGQPTVAERCVNMELLTPEQARGLDRGVRYYVLRKADKLYGRVAVEREYVDRDTVDNCLKKQKLDYLKRKVLARLSKLLTGLDAVTAEEDEAIRQEVVRRIEAKVGRPPVDIDEAAEQVDLQAEIEDAFAFPELEEAGENTEAEAQDEALVEAEAGAEAETEAGVETEAEGEAESETEAGALAEADADSEADTEAGPETPTTESASGSEEDPSDQAGESADLEQLADDLDREADPDELPEPQLSGTKRPALAEHAGFHLPKKPESQGEHDAAEL